MEHKQILSLLGLALRGGRLVLGEEPVEGAARARDARVLLLASDAADNTRRRCQHFAVMGDCLWLRVPFTKAELGQALGRSSVAIAALTDVGLASAVVHRLAEVDPVQYDEAAARLELKAKRAAERRAEQLAHQKNIRTGRKKAKKPMTPPIQEESPVGKRPEGERPRRSGKKPGAGRPGASRPSRDRRSPSPGNRYAHSRPVKKGKGSFRKKEG